MTESEGRAIGHIGNYYGGLHIKEEGGKYFWSIENWDGHEWQEITPALFKALNKFQNDSEKR